MTLDLYHRLWLARREAEGLVIVDGETITVTDAGWDRILSEGAKGTALADADLDREFVRGAHGGAGDVAILLDVIGDD